MYPLVAVTVTVLPCLSLFILPYSPRSASACMSHRPSDEWRQLARRRQLPKAGERQAASDWERAAQCLSLYLVQCFKKHYHYKSVHHCIQGKEHYPKHHLLNRVRVRSPEKRNRTRQVSFLKSALHVMSPFRGQVQRKTFISTPCEGFLSRVPYTVACQDSIVRALRRPCVA